MRLTPLSNQENIWTAELVEALQNVLPADEVNCLKQASIFDSSSSPEARVFYLARDLGTNSIDGFFLKKAAADTLAREVAMTRYFHKRGLGAEVVVYLQGEYISTADGKVVQPDNNGQIDSGQNDWLLTRRLPGQDCTADCYMQNPARLCDTLAERLRLLHECSTEGCPVSNHTELYLQRAQENWQAKCFDLSFYETDYGSTSPQKLWSYIQQNRNYLDQQTLLHGDYCLPNIILDNWELSGFVDLDNAGVGDRHVDIFWALWTLRFNLKTNAYRRRFIDAYGKNLVDEDKLRLIAAIECFG